MKRVTFEVAKAIKEAGYPQKLQEGTAFYAENGLMDVYDSELYELFDPMYCTAPIYLEVWLWLWKRGVKIELGNDYDNDTIIPFYGANFIDGIYENPEEAIIAAIEYLVDNDLIK